MKRNRPKQHMRRLKSGKKIAINKGVKKKIKRSNSIKRKRNFISPISRRREEEEFLIQSLLSTKNYGSSPTNNFAIATNKINEARENQIALANKNIRLRKQRDSLMSKLKSNIMILPEEFSTSEQDRIVFLDDNISSKIKSIDQEIIKNKRRVGEKNTEISFLNKKFFPKNSR